MRYFWSPKKLLIIVTFFIMVEGVEAKKAETKTWREEMRDLSQMLKEIGPDIISNSKNTDPKSFKLKAKKLYELSKSLDPDTSHGTKVPDNDPTLPYLSSLFREDIGLAYRSAQAGNLDYSKDVIRSSISYCIACHTRSDAGPQFPLIDSFSQQLKGAPWVERISFQAATRQFDSVFNEVIKQLQSRENSDIKPLDIEKGVQMALSIAVRVKQKPEQALQLANSVLKSSVATDFMAKNAKAWTKDIEKWQSETKRSYIKDTDYLAHATELVGSPDTKWETTWIPGSEIKYLRASMLMHQMLGRFPNSEYAAEALYLTGLSYDVLQDLGVWSIHEMYFRACIEKKPHSELAERCYARYKESVTLGYSGSAGTFLPSVVQTHLAQLQKMSEVSGKAQKNK